MTCKFGRFRQNPNEYLNDRINVFTLLKSELGCLDLVFLPYYTTRDMAAPPEVTMQSLDGVWVIVSAICIDHLHTWPPSSSLPCKFRLRPHFQNAQLSDSLDPVFTLQGISWLLRKIVSLATITMYAKQEVDDDGVAVITLDLRATGGIKAETEVRKLDWKEVTSKSGFFGTSRHRSRWIDIKGQTQSGYGGPLDTYLIEGWLEEPTEKAGEDNLQDFVVNEKNGWSVEQIWGFATIDGKRYHMRKTLVKKGEQVEKARTVYDWKGKGKS